MSIRKEVDSRPSGGLSTPMTPFEAKLRTESGDDRCFLAILGLETRRNPRAVWGSVGHTADASEHITRCHDQRSKNRDSRPKPAVAKNRS
jgi:hypothetical protein